MSSEGGHLGFAMFNLGNEEVTRLLTRSYVAVNNIQSM